MLTTRRGIRQRTMGLAVDHEPTAPAHSLTTIRLENNRITVIFDDLIVEPVEQFQQAPLRLGIFDNVVLKMSFGVRAVLTPNIQFHLHR